MSRHSLYYLAQNGDVVYVVVISKRGHEPVTETGLANAHGALLSLSPRETDHAYRQEFAWSANGS